MTDAKPDIDLTKQAIHLTDTRRTMTLATASGDIPWAAPVYYVFADSGFCFFSDPDTRHIREAMAAGRCACAIFEESDSWRQMRGLQMSGSIARVRTGPGALRIVAAYLKKFPVTKELMPSGITADLRFFKNSLHAHLFRFSPDRVLYMDNRIRLGYRKEITLP